MMMRIATFRRLTGDDMVRASVGQGYGRTDERLIVRARDIR